MLCGVRGSVGRLSCKLSSSSPAYILSCKMSSSSSALGRASIDGLVIGVHEGGTFTKLGQLLNTNCNGELRRQWNLTSKIGKSGDSVVLFGAHPEYPKIAMVGLGKERHLEEETTWLNNLRVAAGNGIKALRNHKAKAVGVDTSFGSLKATSEGTFLSLYRYHLQPLKEGETDITARPFSVQTTDTEEGEIDAAAFSVGTTEVPAEWEAGRIVAEAQNFARDLAETPSNLLTPKQFCSVVTKKLDSIKSREKIEVVERDEHWIRSQEMGMLLGVAQGSNEPPRVLEIHYRGAPDSSSPPLMFVGKGVTFDSGGISIKPSANMGAMKADMQGAASVVSALYAIASLELPINVSVITPLTENMPSGTAIKPGDVITAMNKKTVEVDNTDAEGRLILGDALCYAQTFKPHTIVDVATLTGAIDVALGGVCMGAFTPSDALWNELSSASQNSSEKVWRMPLFKEYRKQLDSRVADIINSSPKRSGGACTAAIFLKEFVSTNRWLHLDIAGVMQNSEDSAIASKGMSGKPVRTLVELARKYVQ